MDSPTKDNYELLFELKPAEASGLIIGQLHLIKNGKIFNTLRATSSLPGRQFSGSWELKGGLLVPSANLPKGTSYSVCTEPLWMPDIKGVEGSFYQISPFEIMTKGATRGDFGMHFDANFPGSLGCIVFTTQRGWDVFRQSMKLWAAMGLDCVKLTVSFTTWSTPV
jgi:hypothetical protein